MEKGVFNCADEAMVEETISARQKFLSDLPSKVSDLDQQLLQQFKSRRNFIELVDSTSRTWTLTKTGSRVKVGDLVETTMVNEITPELLQSESWKDVEFRSFDVTLESATPRTGRSHPMQSLIERIRHIFLEMGFSELVEDYVHPTSIPDFMNLCISSVFLVELFDIAPSVNSSPSKAGPNNFLIIIKPSPSAVTSPSPSTSRM